MVSVIATWLGLPGDTAAVKPVTYRDTVVETPVEELVAHELVAHELIADGDHRRRGRHVEIQQQDSGSAHVPTGELIRILRAAVIVPVRPGVSAR